MKLRNFITAFTILTLLYQPVRAQEYGTALGVRLGSLTAGFNIKSFVSTSGAIECIIGLGHHSVTITGLYEKHHTINSADGLSWYVGAGAHVGFFDHHGTYLRYKHKDEKYYVYHDDDNAVIPGVDVIIGLEWKIPRAPLKLGMDLKPQIDFHHGAHSYFDAAINLRYIL
jgi:hypothetical protein